jgi:hypothetical protein
VHFGWCKSRNFPATAESPTDKAGRPSQVLSKTVALRQSNKTHSVCSCRNICSVLAWRQITHVNPCGAGREDALQGPCIKSCMFMACNSVQRFLTPALPGNQTANDIRHQLAPSLPTGPDTFCISDHLLLTWAFCAFPSQSSACDYMHTRMHACPSSAGVY